MKNIRVILIAAVLAALTAALTACAARPTPAASSPEKPSPTETDDAPEDPIAILSKSGKIDASGIIEKSDRKDGKFLVMITRRDISEKAIADVLMEKYGFDMELYENSDDDSLDWDAYITAKREAVKSLYLSEAEAFIEETELDRADILEVSSYTGTVIVYAEPETILRCARSDYAEHIYSFENSANEPAVETGEEKP